MKDIFYIQYRDFGLSVTYFRRQAGMTQQQLADKMNISYETVSRIENANTGISFDMLLGLSESLGIKLGELFTHSGL